MLKNCKRCKKTFVVSDNLSFMQYCTPCVTSINKEIELLNNLVANNKSISLDELVNKSSVSKAKIKDYIRSGKVVTPIGFTHTVCVVCGKKIKLGTICGTCMRA